MKACMTLIQEKKKILLSYFWFFTLILSLINLCMTDFWSTPISHSRFLFHESILNLDVLMLNLMFLVGTVLGVYSRGTV